MTIRMRLAGAAALAGALALAGCAGMRGDEEATGSRAMSGGAQMPVAASPASDRAAATPAAINCKPEDAGVQAGSPGQNCGPTGAAGPR